MSALALLFTILKGRMHVSSLIAAWQNESTKEEIHFHSASLVICTTDGTLRNSSISSWFVLSFTYYTTPLLTPISPPTKSRLGSLSSESVAFGIGRGEQSCQHWADCSFGTVLTTGTSQISQLAGDLMHSISSQTDTEPSATFVLSVTVCSDNVFTLHLQHMHSHLLSTGGWKQKPEMSLESKLLIQ